MQITTIAVLGASGFVGRHVCQALAAQGYRVRAATRDRERARERLILLPTAELVQANVHDPAQLAALVRGTDAVINLVGVLHPGRRELSFEEAHVGLARKVVAACGAEGVTRLIHMSALNADPGATSAYLRSKGEAEAIVRGSGLAWTVFRPSVIFGRGDSFLAMFACLLRLLPVVMLGSPGARFQPVYVEDVAQAMLRSLPDVASVRQGYDLCGPRVYTLRQLIEYVGSVTGRRRPVIGLNDTLSYWQARAMELSPVKLLTRDNYYSMKADSVSAAPYPFGITPTALEAVAPVYLGHLDPRTRFQEMRARARRRSSEQEPQAASRGR